MALFLPKDENSGTAHVYRLWNGFYTPKKTAHIRNGHFTGGIRLNDRKIYGQLEGRDLVLPMRKLHSYQSCLLKHRIVHNTQLYYALIMRQGGHVLIETLLIPS